MLEINIDVFQLCLERKHPLKQNHKHSDTCSVCSWMNVSVVVVKLCQCVRPGAADQQCRPDSLKTESPRGHY